LLSLLVAPGLGHVHARAWRTGVAIYCITLASGVILLYLMHFAPTPNRVTLFFVLGLPTVVFWLSVAVDAVLRTRRTGGSVPTPWFRSTWLAAIVVEAVGGGIAYGLPPQWHAFNIASGSMAPALIPGDYFFSDSNTTRKPVVYGDVVLFKLPRDPSIVYVKRVVGLPGDRIRLVNGRLSINNQLVNRQSTGNFGSDPDTKSVLKCYIEALPGGRQVVILKASDHEPLDNTQEFVVPDDRLFVLGDNRDNSLDSRLLTAVGLVPIRNIVGRAGTIFWSRALDRVGRQVE
jgi:signal peptidase I